MTASLWSMSHFQSAVGAVEAPRGEMTCSDSQWQSLPQQRFGLFLAGLCVSPPEASKWPCRLCWATSGPFASLWRSHTESCEEQSKSLLWQRLPLGIRASHFTSRSLHCSHCRLWIGWSTLCSLSSSCLLSQIVCPSFLLKRDLGFD